MTPTDKYSSGVIQVVNRASQYNDKIGSYVEHYVNDQGWFHVKLSDNMRIKMPQEIAQDQEAGEQYVSDDRIKVVAESVWSYSN